MEAANKMKAKRYYVHNSIAPFEEDATHEFKGHRNLAVEELPPWTRETNIAKASRKAGSRNLNAFLNTGKGGTLYLGILDSGAVKGIELSQCQRDHIVGSLDDLMTRYVPAVAPHRYKVQFVPVVHKSASDDVKLQHCLYNTGAADMSCVVDRSRPHQLRSYRNCWCDSDAIAQISCGTTPPTYVIEITMKPWDPHDPLNHGHSATSFNLHPIHEDEEGHVYFRRQATVVLYTLNEIADITRHEVQSHYNDKIHKVKAELEKYRKEMRSRSQVT